MSSPSSPTIGLVSANIKLFNSKSDNDSNVSASNSTPTTNGPPLPPKPTKKPTSYNISTSSYTSVPLNAPTPPPLPATSPPQLPSTPPRPINRLHNSNTTSKLASYTTSNNNNNIHPHHNTNKKRTTANNARALKAISPSASPPPPPPPPIHPPPTTTTSAPLSSTSASTGSQSMAPIVAQKSGSTLKVMFGKVVGSVSGKKKNDTGSNVN